jgi:hypothetical protein
MFVPGSKHPPNLNPGGCGVELTARNCRNSREGAWRTVNTGLSPASSVGLDPSPGRGGEGGALNPEGRATHIGEQHARVAAGRPEPVASAAGLPEGLARDPATVEHALQHETPSCGRALREHAPHVASQLLQARGEPLAVERDGVPLRVERCELPVKRLRSFP